MVCYSISALKIFTLEKRLLFENGINQTLMKQLKLYSVMRYFIIIGMLSLNFKVALILLWFLIITCIDPLVWYVVKGSNRPVASGLKRRTVSLKSNII